MTYVTHLVVQFDHDTKTLSFDGDGSREWIRRLFEEETNTWDSNLEDWTAVSPEIEKEATDALTAIGIEVEKEWQDR